MHLKARNGVGSEELALSYYIPWKSKTKQRMVFRMIYVKNSLLPLGKVWSLDFLGIHIDFCNLVRNPSLFASLFMCSVHMFRTHSSNSAFSFPCDIWWNFDLHNAWEGNTA